MLNTFIAVAVVAAALAILIPIVFLFRHPGKKMDISPYRSWLVGTLVLAAVSLLATFLAVVTQ